MKTLCKCKIRAKNIKNLFGYEIVLSDYVFLINRIAGIFKL